MISRLRALWRNLFDRGAVNRDLDEEVRGYLEMLTAEKVHRGMDPGEALREARREFEGVEQVKQSVRNIRTGVSMDTMMQDLRYALRTLARSPGFSAVVVLTLAFGIGANTAVFTLIHAVMLKQLPVANPHQLYRVGEGEFFCCEWGGLQDTWGTFDYPFYKHLRDTDPSFDQIAAFSGSTPTFNLRRAGVSAAAQSANGEYVSGNYFSTLGLQAAAGRLLGPADDRPEAPAAAVMGFRAWKQQYASDPSLIGSTLLINGLPVTVVGIAPEGFFGDRLSANPPQVWLPLSLQPAFEGQGQKSLLYSSGDAWLYVIGRLKPGLSPAAVQTRLTSELQQWLRAEHRDTGEDKDKIAQQHIRLTAGGAGISSFRDSSKTNLWLLSAASILVLLIACANLANLLLARTASRQQQTALRLALGAGRSRLIRAVLTESLLLSLTGGAVGLGVAYIASKGILVLAFRGAAYVPISAAPSLPILGFALCLSILTAVVFAIVPAWVGTRAYPADGLRLGSRGATRHGSQPQKALIVVQAALSVVLLAVAGLVTQSLRNLEKTDLGFQPQGRLVATLSFKAAGYTPERLPAAYQQVQNRLEQIPGVRSASLSLNSPQNLCCISLDVSLGGHPDNRLENIDVGFSRVSPHYFETIGTPVLRGRAFNQNDTQASPHVAVVDESFARTFFPGEDAIGKHFGSSLQGHGYDYEIVGIVKDTAYRNLGAVQRPMYFLPFSQTTSFGPSGYQRLETGTLYASLIELSVTGAPESYERAFRSALAEVDPNLSVISLKSYTEQVAIQFNQQRLLARLTGLFSLLALLLASLGLYGVTAYNVSRRTAEIGIRMALGANRSNVVSMVLRGALLQVAVGLVIGTVIAIVCGRYLAHQLYGVSRFDPLVLGGAILVLSACALIAGLVPARRAASTEPVEALRIE